MKAIFVQITVGAFGWDIVLLIYPFDWLFKFGRKRGTFDCTIWGGQIGPLGIGVVRQEGRLQ